jgi:phosphate transport system substrate-binding protein
MTEAPTEVMTEEPAMTEAPTEVMTEEPAMTEAPTEVMTEEPVMTEAPTEEPAAGVTLPEVNPAESTGEIITAGSSTVFPLSERMAELWEDEGGPTVTIDSVGSGAGFERFCVNAETDISNASRAIEEDEIAACQANGREPVEFRVGTDALAIVVSQENDFVEDLTLEQLAQAFSTAQTWADLDPSWPAEPIQRFSPGTDSGTYDYFVEVVLADDETPIQSAENIQYSEDDNVLVQGVLGSPYAIGYFGYAYYQENQDTLKALSIDGVAPTAETAESNEYPLSRPLFIYSDPGIMAEKPQVAAFINYYLTYVNDEILDVGYFPASTEALDQAKQNWLDAVQ